MMAVKRIYHTFDKWECYPAGFYENKPKDRSLTDPQCRESYATFLRDIPAFEKAMDGVLADWKHSCEHYLTNEKMNRIAWLGQASMCYANGIPSIFCGGFSLLSKEEQEAANAAALRYLNIWLERHGEELADLEAAGINAKANIY